MGSPAAPSPYQQVTSTEEMPKWKKELLGFTPNAPEYSPFKALSRQAGTQAKMIEGMTSRPSWSSMYEAYGVAPGSDLTPYIQATRQGTQGPMAPIPASPAAGTIPEFIPPSEEVKKKEAAQGGLMSLRKGYAPGGAVKPKYTAKTSAPDKYSALQDAVNSGYKPKPAELQFMQTMADNQSTISSLGATPYSIDAKTGAIKPVSRGATQTSSDYTNYLSTLSGAGVGIDPKVVKQYNVQTPSTVDKGAPSAVPYSQAMDVVTPFYNPKGAENDPYGGVTNPVYRQALDQLRAASNAPETIGQGAGIMSQAAKDLMKQAGYTPQQINAAELQGTAAQMGPYERVTTDPYVAARMTAPQQAAVKDYEAAQMQAAQMQGREAKASQIARGDIRDIAAQMADVERYNAAQIERTQREQAATTQGPKSWTDPGVAQQYMNPYQQAVTDIAKRESMRDYGKQLAQLRSQATQSKAFGGTRAALQESEAQRGQAQRMGDIEAQGLQQAYQSGMGQFSAEQGLGAQVGMSNTAQINQLKQQYMSMGLSEAQANQAAINQASQQNAAAQNTAYNNYVAQQLQAQQANQQMDWNAANQNAQLAQQAELANQQYGLGGFQSNLQNAQFAQQANQANQAAINQQRSQYVNNALQAAMQAYGGQLTAEQQNQAALNAASQFNAQQNLQGQMANQQAGLTTEQQNAQLRQQMGLANQQVGLQAAIQNQQAGLTGQGLNLQALNQAGQMGQGLGALGNQTWGNQQNISQLWGAAGQTVQNLAQQAATGAQQTAQNWWGGMGNAYQPVTNLITGTPGATGTKNVSQAPQ